MTQGITAECITRAINEGIAGKDVHDHDDSQSGGCINEGGGGGRGARGPGSGVTGGRPVNRSQQDRVGGVKPQTIATPPLGRSTWPVMNREASEAR